LFTIYLCVFLVDLLIIYLFSQAIHLFHLFIYLFIYLFIIFFLSFILSAVAFLMLFLSFVMA